MSFEGTVIAVAGLVIASIVIAHKFTLTKEEAEDELTGVYKRYYEPDVHAEQKSAVETQRKRDLD